MDPRRPSEPGPSRISPQHEEELLEAVLHRQIGIDPHQTGPILDLAALGLVNDAWRNGPVEDWHTQGRLHDGDMLRINAATTHRVRQLIRRWRADLGLATDAPVAVLDTLDPDATDWMAHRIWRWLVNPRRRLPTGATLAAVAADDLEDYRNHVEQSLGGFAGMAEQRGARYAIWRTAAHGGLACRHWWGSPAWAALVARFLVAINDPADPHWGQGAARRIGLPVEPDQIQDRSLLRRLLLREPWSLHADAAGWLVQAGIGFLLPTLPPLPTPATDRGVNT